MRIHQRYFTVEEAQALLPKVKTIMTTALKTKEQIELKVDHWRTRQGKLEAAEEAILRAQIDFLAGQLEEQLSHLTNLGCLPKDLTQGLVDFPARINGREGFLCWMLGEPTVNHWHGITEGFKGRRTLPLNQEALS